MAFLGIAVIFGSIVFGYLLENGKLALLNQPAEFTIIGGAALGIVLISAPIKVQVQIIGGLLQVFKGKVIRKAHYLNLLALFNEIFQMARRDGLLVLESHVEHPETSSLFKKYPDFLARHHALEFFTDSAKMIIAGGLRNHELEALMDADLEVHHEDTAKPVGILNKLADSMPGLGIVAAVLGIVITMQAIDGPPEELGHKVGAALVGTFLGILMSYGVFGPLASNLEEIHKQETVYLNCIKAGLLAFEKGLSPMIALEFARRSISAADRPSMAEMNDSLRRK